MINNVYWLNKDNRYSISNKIKKILFWPYHWLSIIELQEQIIKDRAKNILNNEKI